jgi:hypothetical protein
MMYFRGAVDIIDLPGCRPCVFVYPLSSEELFKIYVLVLKFKDRVGDKMWDVGDAHTVSHCHRPCAVCRLSSLERGRGLCRQAGSTYPRARCRTGVVSFSL